MRSKVHLCFGPENLRGDKVVATTIKEKIVFCRVAI